MDASLVPCILKSLGYTPSKMVKGRSYDENFGQGHIIIADYCFTVYVICNVGLRSAPLPFMTPLQ